jgi:hypothetical protein
VSSVRNSQLGAAGPSDHTEFMSHFLRHGEALSAWADTGEP